MKNWREGTEPWTGHCRENLLNETKKAAGRKLNSKIKGTKRGGKARWNEVC